MDPMIFASASVIVIGAIAAAAVTVINAIGNMKTALLKASEARAEEIHSLVNGSASKAADKLTALEGQVVALHMEVSRLQEQRVEDAKTKAASERL